MVEWRDGGEVVGAPPRRWGGMGVKVVVVECHRSLVPLLWGASEMIMGNGKPWRGRRKEAAQIVEYFFKASKAGELE
jgi:hypothetical protein